MYYKRDLDKNTLYQGVKTLVECPDLQVHLSQQKLFTLFSVAFQYILYWSTKKPGHYIIRAEDSFLAERLARKAKDESTRKFMSKLLVPRRLIYQNSTFHLDYFHLSSWAMTKDLAKEKIQGAIIIKNTSENPLIEETDFRYVKESEELGFSENYYIESLKDFVPRIVMIAFEKEYDLPKIKFDFIKPSQDRLASGVKISEDLIFDED